MDIKTLRWQKTRKLVSAAGGISRFAERIERTQQQVNRFAGPNPVTGIGDKIARLIEVSFDLEHGFLDKPGDHQFDLSAPASSGSEAIHKADLAASAYVEAKIKWLKARPQMLYMVRIELRELLLNNGIDINKELDDSFLISRFDQSLRIDLFIPLAVFDVYRYRSSYSMSLPDILAIPSSQPFGKLAFHLIPKSILESLPDNTEIRFDENRSLLNSTNIEDYLNNLSALL